MTSSIVIRLGIGALLLGIAGAAGAQNIYKCTTGGHVEYTDRPCAGDSGKLIHQADDSEVIDQYLRLGQTSLALRYAQSHHIEPLYKARLAAHQQDLAEQARQQADAAAARQQREAQEREQALADAEANRAQLEAQNDALRQQNDDYRDQLAQPVYVAPPVYWGGPRYPYRDHPNGGHGHGHDDGHRPPPVSREPVFHPCTQLAGGRVQC